MKDLKPPFKFCTFASENWRSCLRSAFQTSLIALAKSQHCTRNSKNRTQRHT